MLIPPCINIKMRNVSNRSCRENHNTHYVEQRGRAREAIDENKKNAFALHAGSVRLHAPASLNAPIFARTHTQKYVIFIAFPPKKWF